MIGNYYICESHTTFFYVKLYAGAQKVKYNLFLDDKYISNFKTTRCELKSIIFKFTQYVLGEFRVNGFHLEKFYFKFFKKK